jgi:hypothetical protein
MPAIQERRILLTAERRPSDVRGLVECYLRPIFEQAEREGSHYVSFVAMLAHYARRDVFNRQPAELLQAAQGFRVALASHLDHLPETLRVHRIEQMLKFAVHAAADRERANRDEEDVLPVAAHLNDLFDGLVGFLEAALSKSTLNALEATTAQPSRGTLPI